MNNLKHSQLLSSALSSNKSSYQSTSRKRKSIVGGGGGLPGTKNAMIETALKQSKKVASRKRKTTHHQLIVPQSIVIAKTSMHSSAERKNPLEQFEELFKLNQFANQMNGSSTQNTSKRPLSSREPLLNQGKATKQCESERCSPADKMLASSVPTVLLGSGTRVKIHQFHGGQRPFSRESSKNNPKEEGSAPHSRVRDTSSNESLERIHTFSLKTSFQNLAAFNKQHQTSQQQYYAASSNENAMRDGDEDTPISLRNKGVRNFGNNEGPRIQRQKVPSAIMNDMSAYISSNPSSTSMAESQEEETSAYNKGGASTTLLRQRVNPPLNVAPVAFPAQLGSGSKAYYVEESVKILQHVISQADPILGELVSKVKQFERWYLRQRS